MRSLGEIKLDDLTAIGRLQGQDGLPYPFGPSHSREEHHSRISTVADRLAHGDLSALREWTDAYIAAEIWVACRVFHASDDTPDTRILAYRAGGAGYLAAQNNNDDVVEVFGLSADDLGAAIASSVGLTAPGTQPRIVIPGYVGYFSRPAASDYDDGQLSSVCVAAHESSGPADAVVADEEVTAIAIIQSRWQPPRRWGVDWTKKLVAWIRVDADGDYIYTPEFSHAVPLPTEQFLSERIDSLIAEDISALRLQRRI